MICFVTNEILPEMRGGIGFYIEEAMAMLERAGLQTCLVVSSPRVDPRRTEEHLRSVGIAGAVFGAAHAAGAARVPGAEAYAEERLPGVAIERAFASPAYEMSYRVACLLEDVCRRFPVELVEFIDYGGSGFVPIRMKRLLGRFEKQVLAVRVHGTAEVIRESEGRRYGLQAPLLEYFAERYAVRHADVLIASTPSMLADYERLHGRRGPGVVSPLPVRRLTEHPVPLRPVKRPPCKVFFVGTCLRHKAPEVFVQAAVRLLGKGLQGVTFVLMGRDFPTSVRYGSYEEELKRMVPDELKGHFEFRCTAYGPTQLLEAAETCSFVALPARWEAFCLVAHELRWLGVPLVLSDIPPFRDCFEDGKDAVFCDGTAEGLADVMERMLTGEITLAGREDVESLYVDPDGFAQVYRDQVAAQGSRAAPPSAPVGPLVSAVVASEGDPERIAVTIRSVLASTHQDVEVLVIEAGEGGATRPAPADMADERVRSVGRCRARHAAGGTRAEALNRAIEAARGEFVCCLRAGCTVSPDYFARALGALARCPEAAYVSCFAGVCSRSVGPAGLTAVRTPYGLEPVLVTVEDRTGLGHAVVRRSVFAEGGVRYREELFAFEDWELGWTMAERGLAGEVLPEVHVFCDRQTEAAATPRTWVEQYHLLQRMAEAHPDLVRDHAAEMLKAHIQVGKVAIDTRLTDAWLLANYRGLRLVRVGLQKCLGEGPRAVFSHFWHKVRQQAGVLRASLSGRRRPEGGPDERGG